ncbi:MAG: response regulator [Chitinophagaceae bacterium]
MRLLVVEDEPDVASFLKKTLEEENYEITVAMDGSMAWEYINLFKYDLFIFDVMLPGIDGLQLCKKCRQHEITTPILMLTALGATDNIVMGLDSGALSKEAYQGEDLFFFKQRFINRQIAWCYSLSRSLRKQDSSEGLEKYLLREMCSI